MALSGWYCLPSDSEVAEPTSSCFAACSQFNQFGSNGNMHGMFGPPHGFMGTDLAESAIPETADLQAQILDESCLIGPAGFSDKPADFGAPPPVTMEASGVSGVPNQQPCKYDLLSNVPC